MITIFLKKLSGIKTESRACDSEIISWQGNLLTSNSHSARFCEMCDDSGSNFTAVDCVPPHPSLPRGVGRRRGQRVPLMQPQPAGTCCCCCCCRHVPTCVTLLPATIVSVPGATGGAAVKSVGGLAGWMSRWRAARC